MKKYLFMIVVLVLLLFLTNTHYVIASEPVKIVSLTNKCSVVKNNRTSINVKVLAKNEGVMTSLIPDYTLGMIDNNKNEFNIRLSEIHSNENISNIVLDYNRDGNGKSYIYYQVDEDIKTNKLDQILSFNIDIEFLETIPDSFDVLGSEVILSEDLSICEEINGFKITEIEKNISIEKENTENSKIIYYIIFCLGILLIFGICWKLKQK